MEIFSSIAELWADLLDGLITFFDRAIPEVIRDSLDILIVATMFYSGLLVLKGTRAMQMVWGILLTLAGYAFARWLGLISVLTIFESLATSFVLVVVVIFQADIRRALMRVGGGSFFRQNTNAENAGIDEVLKAAANLAQKRIGALIVFHGKADLSEFASGGTLLDADISGELLFSIFIPSFENPMHDGALIIRNGRIWKAGTVLPLSTAPLDRAMGTRHRAALGITEETDAIVVVVSEERGQISLCAGGTLKKNLEGELLRSTLFGLLNREVPAAPPPSAGRTNTRPSITPPASSSMKLERVSMISEQDDLELLSTTPTSELDTREEGSS